MDRRKFLKLLGGAGAYSLAPSALKGQDPVQLQPVPEPQNSVSSQPLLSREPLTSFTPPARYPTAEELFNFSESDIKFRIEDLMAILKDPHHEGLVLSAYPDPATGDPLIGAGVSLAIPEGIRHDQIDPKNQAVQFMESSSRTLWQASGLDPGKLDAILARYADRWDQVRREIRFRPGETEEKKNKQTGAEFRRRILSGQWASEPGDITPAEADRFLRTAIIQAVHNAQAYYPPEKFAAMKPSQQMALVEMVYQIGDGLEAFATFLNRLNDNTLRASKSTSRYGHETHIFTDDRWRDLQWIGSRSKWAQHQSPARAKEVLAKFDPEYDFDKPKLTENRIARFFPHAPARRATLLAGNEGTGETHEKRIKNKSYHGNHHSRA